LVRQDQQGAGGWYHTHLLSEQGPMPHTVAIEKGEYDAYWFVDWRRPTDELISSQTIVDAISAICRQYGFAGKGEVDVFFPMT
jgi:hypothetical protein